MQIENAQYGFRRNLLGLRPLGLAVDLVCVAVLVAGIALKLGAIAPPSLTRNAIESLRLMPLLCAMALCVVMLGFWCLVVTEQWVRAAADQYANALLGTCDAAAAAGQRRTGKRATE